jgi:hypothetical protein
MRPTENIENLIKTLNIKAGVELGERTIRDAIDAMPDIETTRCAKPQSGIWRNMMKSKMTKYAAAAAVIIAVLIGIDQLGGKFGGSSVAWGDVIKPILNARTVILDMVVGSGKNQAVIHDEVMGSRIRRTISNMGQAAFIIDLDQKKLLTLDTAQKTAIYIGLDGLDKFKNYIEQLRNTIISLQKKPDFHVENKGLQKIDSRNCVVFVAKSSNETITIWADPKAALPIRIEEKTPNMQITCENMQFDVALDKSRFSMEPPAGYKVIQNPGVDFKKNSESGFVESLRIWAQITEGQFPESIKIEDIVKDAPKFGQALEHANLTPPQIIETAMRWGQGLVFIRFFKGQGQWHYAGQGIQLGDRHTPIFWYQPQKSKTWRVIYGDLSVKEVTRDELTKLEADSTARILRYEKQPKPIFEGRQIDKWHLTASGNVSAHCTLTVDKILADAVKMPVCLPHVTGKLQSAKIGNTELPFVDLGKGKYELTLPAGWAALNNKTIEIVWTIPLNSLKQGENGFRANLSGLILLTSYSLTIILEDGCGYVSWGKDPSVRQVPAFNCIGSVKPTRHFGSCGFAIKKSK